MMFSLARRRTPSATLSLVLLASLGACGPTGPACPDGFTPVAGRCFPAPHDDSGPLDDAALAIDAGAPDDAASVDGAALDDAGSLDAAALDDAGCTIELTYFVDRDGDGFGAGSPLHGCAVPEYHVTLAGDCDDDVAARHPGAAEVCNHADDDCDATVDEGVLTRFFADADGDGFGDEAHPLEACTVPAEHAANDDDCDDGAASTHPGAAEICNGNDDDCDAAVDEGVLIAFYPDCDGDDFAGPSAPATIACTEPPPSSTCAGGWTQRAPTSPSTIDCRVADARAFPGQTMWFSSSTVPRAPGEPIVVGYDFDCDGVETRQHTGAAPATCVPDRTGFCGQRGWADGTPPACGVTEAFTTCGLLSCTRSTTYVAQPCH